MLSLCSWIASCLTCTREKPSIVQSTNPKPETPSRMESSIDQSANPRSEKSGRLDRPQHFDQLPRELKKMILRQCDYGTLRSIVHASPGFHSFYLGAREELLALVTIRQLLEHGFDFFGKYNVIEAGGLEESIREAAGTLYLQCQRHVSTNFKHVIRLDVRSCIVLLRVKHAMGWRLEVLEGRGQFKLKCQIKLLGGLQRRRSLDYEFALLSPQHEPAWKEIHSEIVIKMMMRKHLAPRDYARRE